MPYLQAPSSLIGMNPVRKFTAQLRPLSGQPLSVTDLHGRTHPATLPLPV